MIQAQIFSVITGSQDVIDIVSNRVHPMRMPQGGALPAVVYQIITAVPTNSLDGDSGLDLLRLQVKSWAKTYAQAHALAEAVRNALTGAGSLKVVTEFYSDGQDDQTLSFCVTAQYFVWSVLDADAVDQVIARGLVYHTFIGDGVTTIFTFPSNFKSGSLLLFRNGALATKGEQYTELLDRSGISFPIAPEGGSYKDEFVAFYAKG